MAFLTEADTCRKYVLPKLYAAGWTDDQISEQKSFTDGRIVVAGSKVKRLPQCAPPRRWQIHGIADSLGSPPVNQKKTSQMACLPIYSAACCMSCRNGASFAVALNCGIGSSSLNAEVKALTMLQSVLGANSST